MNYEDRITKSYLENALANAGVRIATGSYVGDGTYGKNNQTSVTLPFTPKLFMVCDGNTRYDVGLWFPGVRYMHGMNSENIDVSQSGNTVSWYSTQNATYQYNANNCTFHWLAIG